MLSPEPSEVGKLYTTFSSPEESFVCEDSKGRQVLFSLDEELPTWLECVQRQVCISSAKCEYTNYVEMCEVETNSEVLLYQENCMAVEYIRRGGMDAEMNKEWLCQPQNEDLREHTKKGGNCRPKRDNCRPKRDIGRCMWKRNEQRES